ncbi:FUSC family protein [Bradyrhizobium lablabi]|uniref:FUSC family protein n=1 Tax=Bradyrhizobium lablabi TaxID=722472 RepID=UPI001BAA3F80|nr:FUSC family protein [Bradyrhizobium lablabi]MBR0695604.1 FUSC family protein [Bradyrhizobium lablabi]
MQAGRHGPNSTSTAGGRASASWDALLSATSRAAPALLFGIRLWAAVCLALYVAFWLELDNAFWAGTSAALVCHPHLGASLRKGWFRMIGTLVGAVAIVALTAIFPQNRAGFLLSLALWGGLCALVSTLLRNFAAYAVALAGFTAAIIAGDELGAVGGANGEAFTLAIARVSEIWIGIVCAGIVLAGTDFGGAQRRLAELLAELAGDIASRFTATLRRGSPESLTQKVRREFIRRVIATDPVIDEVKGESAALRYHSPVLQQAVDAMFAVLAAWRIVDSRLRRALGSSGAQETHHVLRAIPTELREALERSDRSPWLSDPARMRGLCRTAFDTLVEMPSRTVSLRLLADQTAAVIAGLSRVLDGLTLLAGDTVRESSPGRGFELHVSDWLPALVNAGRAFATIVAVQIFWIWTEWPNGPLAITFAAITVILLSPRSDESYAAAVKFTAGAAIAALAAATVLFAGLPNVDSFVGFAIVLGIFLVPAGAMMAQPWNTVLFVAITANFVPLLGPANQMSYNTIQFYNAALAIVAGGGAGALSFRLIPPLSPELRSWRLLALSLRDLRRLAADPGQREHSWEGRLYSRIAALPVQAEPLHRALLITALAVGQNMVLLQRSAGQFGCAREIDAALRHFSSGDCEAMVTELEAADRRLAALAGNLLPAMRASAEILAIRDALSDHRTYFETGAEH